MAFNPFKILKGLIIQKENTLTPDKIEITPNGTASTTTIIQSSQTVNRTITLPDATDTLATVTNVNTVQTNLDNHINDATDAHDASAISNVPAGTIASTDVQAAINELDGDIQGHITDTTDAHDASAISNVPSGNLVATDVQSALNEIQSELDSVSVVANAAATKELDNLGITAINASLLPDTDVAYELGSSTLAWNGVFTNAVIPPALSPLSITNNDDAITVDAATDLNLSGTNNVIVTSDDVSLTASAGAVSITSANPINVNSQIITGVAAPVSASDAVNKEYADSISAGLDPKQAVRVATTTSLGGSYATTPSNGRFTGAATSVDGVTLVAGDRVLVKDQVDQKQNGIYVYDGAGQYTRSADMDGSPSSEVSAGNYTFTTQGTLNSATGYVLTGNGLITLNTDNVVFTQFSGGSSGASRFLDNLLSPTAINQDLVADTNNSRDLGSNSIKFKDVHVAGSVKTNSVSPTTGNLNLNTDATATSGAISVVSGASTGASGNVSLRSGTSSGGTSGSITVGSNSGNSSGDTTILTGTGNTTTSGDINIQTGAATTTKGKIKLDAAVNLVQGNVASATIGQQSLTIPSSGSTEGIPLLTASDSTVREILTSGAEGLPQAQNLIDNGDAEGKLTSSTSILVPYADAAQSTPVDGTGGSPNVTTAVTATNPLAGSKSYTLVKDAVNRQGQGWSIPFTVNPSNRARVLSIKFDYIVDSGTFVAGTSTTDSDVTVYIYDVTNSTLIQPSSFKLLSNSTTIADQFQAEFQTSQSGSSYRLILHCATTSASAYTLKVDNIIVSPSEYVFGSPISDWQSYTPTANNGIGTTTSNEYYYRRNGQSIDLWVKATLGTTTASEMRIGLPAGINTAGTSIIPTIHVAGVCGTNVTGGAETFIVLAEPSVNYVTFGFRGAGASTFNKINGNIFSSGSVFGFTASVPIAGWSSSVQMADSTSTRIVSFNGTQSSQAVTANTTNITLTAVKDSHAAWSTNIYTVPVAGDYFICSTFQCSGAGSSTQVYKNGTVVQGFGTDTAATGVSTLTIMLPDLKVGDTIAIRSTTTNTVSNGNVSISRISGPAQIASVERTLFSGYVSTNQALTANTTNLPVTSLKDTHAAWNGSLFTCPTSGDYEVSSTMIGNGAASLKIYVNGSLYSVYHGVNNTAWTAGSVVVENRLAGDTISIRSDTNVTITGGATTAGSRVSIKRLGGTL